MQVVEEGEEGSRMEKFLRDGDTLPHSTLNVDKKGSVKAKKGGKSKSNSHDANNGGRDEG